MKVDRKKKKRKEKGGVQLQEGKQKNLTFRVFHVPPLERFCHRVIVVSGGDNFLVDGGRVMRAIQSISAIIIGSPR